MKQLLKELTSLNGTPGYEQDVVTYLTEKLTNMVDELTVDPLGSVIAVKKGRGNQAPAILLSAHLDEVGFIIKKIEQNGLLRFEKNGGNDDRTLLAQKVTVKSNKGPLLGVIGTISAHYAKFDDPAKVRIHRELYIDVGARSKQEAVEMGIEVGQAVTWYSEMATLGDGRGSRLVGKSFDDRAGCAVLIKCLEELRGTDHQADIIAVFSVQEEVGLRGATVAAYDYQVDVALAVDTTAVSDTPENLMDDSLGIGRGPGIKVQDFSLVSHPFVKMRLVEQAKKLGIPYQLEVFPGIGTDAGAIHKQKGGIPSGVVSIPSRYAHSPVEVIDYNDLVQCEQLVRQFILSITSKEEIRFLYGHRSVQR